MPQFGAPPDPYCPKNGFGQRLRFDKDQDENLNLVAKLATEYKLRAWTYGDGKISLTGERIKKAFGRPAPVVFGGDGATVEQTAKQAVAFMKDHSDQLRARKRVSDSIERHVKTLQMEPVHVKAIEDIPGVGPIIASTRMSANYSDSGRYLIGAKWFGDHPKAGAAFLLVENQLASLGKHGRELAGRFRRMRELEDRLYGTLALKVKTALDRLNPVEKANWADWVEKGKMVPGMRAPVLEQVQKDIVEGGVFDNLYTAAQMAGLKVRPKVGPDGEVNLTGRYFPHIFDLAFAKDKRLTEKLIEDTQRRLYDKGIVVDKVQTMKILENQGIGTPRDLMIRKLQKQYERVHGTNANGEPLTLSRSEANDLLDNVITRNASRLAHNLESGRIGVDGYIKDPYRAYDAALRKNVRRLAEHEYLGPKDRYVHDLIDGIERELTGGASDYARRVYHLEVGHAPVDMDPILRELYNWQNAKLSLGVLGNMSQSFNALVTAGVRPFLRGAIETLNARKLRNTNRFLSETGAVPTQLLDDSGGTMRVIGLTQDDMREHGLRALVGPEALGTEASLTDRVLARAGWARRWATKGLLLPFNTVESYLNRNLAVRTGQHYFDQLMQELARKGERGIAGNTLLRRRFEELDLSAERMLDLVQQKDNAMYQATRDLAGLRISNATQFRSGVQSLPLWAHESALGKFFFQFKTFALGQVNWFAKELTNAGRVFQGQGDPVRAMRALGAITVAFPVIGIELTKARAHLMGPTMASDTIQELLEDPTTSNIIWAGVLGMATSGALGIVADVAATAAVGNTFSLRSYAVPPAGSSVLNGLDIMGSAARGIYHAITDGDTEQAYYQARAAMLRELGGLGGFVEHNLRVGEGREE